MASAAINSEDSTVQCASAAYTRSTPLDLTLTDAGGNLVLGTFSGLTISITGARAADCAGTYNKLLYKKAAGLYFVATTTSEQCRDQAGNLWPCPLTGPDIDLVAAIDQALTNSQEALDNSLPGTESSDLKTALQDIKGEACCSCTSSPCAPCSASCTSQDIAEYLLTIKN
jgi:hypothetical protein